MKKIASELMTSEVTLKNSNFDFWNKKIEVNYLLNNAGITVKILTPSKLANDIIEQKLDYLIDKYKQTYSGVTIEKLGTVYSKELEKNDIESGVNKVTLFIRVIILGIGALFLVIYVIQYKNGNKNLLVIATNKNVFDKFSKQYAKALPENIVIGNINNIKSVLDSDNILFVEEYGITRYKNFEEQLQVIKNLNKNVLGVVTYNL